MLVKPHMVHPGDRFGRFTVKAYSHNDKRWRRHYLVICDCGAEKTVQGTLLRSGNTQSCGCLIKDSADARRLPNDAGVVNQIILQYRRHARDRKIGWHLTFHDVDNLVRRPCHYCGDPSGNVKRTKNHMGFPHNGIDRRSREEPYTLENCVSCCGKCNMAKGKMSESEFIAHATRIADQWGNYIREHNPDLI